ncbi:MAG TPA: Calx-beta domain-containing protein [Pyrinomonadaceae bacterium]
MQPRIITLLGLVLLLGAWSSQPVLGASTQAQTFTISGRVTDGFGNGIGTATVTLSGAQSAVTTTDNQGNYSFTNLPAGGNYTLSPSKADGQYIAYGNSVNNLSSDQTTVTLRLERYVTVFMRVTDSSGHGVGDVEIRINDFSFPLARTNSNGTANMSITEALTGSINPFITITPIKAGYIFSPSSATFSVQSVHQDLNFTASVSVSPVAFIQFSSSSYFVGEGDGSALINVTRTGDTTSAVSVSYFTSDAGVATQKSDYTLAAGTLQFAPGETSKTFRVLITDNAYVQGTHTLFLQLSNATGNAVLGSPTFVTLSIFDNDTQTPTTNPIDGAQLFVRQHYYDFLNRLPDQGGLTYWKEQITGNSSNTPPPCPAGDSACLNSRRVSVSAAYFIENEFQQTGHVIYRLNRAALGLIPDYTHFMVERNNLMPGPQLQQTTLAYTAGFVERPIFKQFYPDSMTPAQFVNKLFDTAGLTPFTEERQQLIQDMMTGAKSRAQVLLEVIELPAFKEKEFNPAFVLMQYYGYLRRDPDPGGYQFWLDVVNNRVTNNYRAMVCAFITSAEYQQRFSPVVTHTNSECGP